MAKTLSIYAGWDASFTTWRPQDFPVTLDAGGQGCRIVISGTVAPTLAGLYLQNDLVNYPAPCSAYCSIIGEHVLT